MSGIRTFAAGAAPGRSRARRSVSVCIPCRDEAATIGEIVSAVRTELMGSRAADDGLVAELIVLDDRSTDATARVAADAGARVVPIEEVHSVHGVGRGKGNALWATLVASVGDVVVWCDGDLTGFQASWVVDLATPLLEHDDVALVKAMYRRPADEGGGGRTTELVARPLLSRFFPELAAVAQPLAGEYAVRRDVVERLELEQGWGVEIALLIDIARERGVGAIGQIDLGVRHHRHRDLRTLSVQAAEVAAAVLERAGVAGGGAGDGALLRADGSRVPLNRATRPPIAARGRVAS
ncbi:glucosyl-3-phosphoglycerate synthase [Ilumatobacter sp.]|uniref:glucosyl-3-phosphoglycerate synthase n=1 Tax=Ilumatobacter sp. TaxID=1967498 RepID=UPI003B5273CA